MGGELQCSAVQCKEVSSHLVFSTWHGRAMAMAMQRGSGNKKGPVRLIRTVLAARHDTVCEWVQPLGIIDGAFLVSGRVSRFKDMQVGVRAREASASASACCGRGDLGLATPLVLRRYCTPYCR